MTTAIFKSYTGNAMLNNALMTIEALTESKSVLEITPLLLKELYRKMDLLSINKRLKNYTMLFTKNGPLHNDKTYGIKIYEALFYEIVDSCEYEGELICEVSGLKFNTTFDVLFRRALKKIGLSDAEIKKKDTSLSRMWFPLIGGLGSDAQALPQAKFTINIHPICIAILQFLPLSSLLYKGGVLLIDSSNFSLSKRMVANNVKILSEKIEITTTGSAVENVKDFSKGDYILKVLNILIEKQEMEESYSDINFWSFSNSGTGASCEIDRVPNELIKKLLLFLEDPKIGNELKGILTNPKSSSSFLECLEDNKDWFLLYPNVFGSGKKKVEYEGVSPLFLETYYKIIQSEKLLEYARYISGLINKYKSKDFENILVKTDAWSDPEYRVELYKVLIKATEKGDWDLLHHTQIMDNNQQLPLRNHFYNLHKLIHYYYQKNIFDNVLPDVYQPKNKAINTCEKMIGVIQNDIYANRIIADLINPNEFAKVGFFRILTDALSFYSISFEDIIDMLYNEDFQYSKHGLNELLRIFFSQNIQKDFSRKEWKDNYAQDVIVSKWLSNIEMFAEDYKNYYCEKYSHRETGELPIGKFSSTVNSIIREQSGLKLLLQEAVENVNNYLYQKGFCRKDKWNIDDLLANPLGNYDTMISLPAIKFELKKQAIKLMKQKEKIINN